MENSYLLRIIVVNWLEGGRVDGAELKPVSIVKAGLLPLVLGGAFQAVLIGFPKALGWLSPEKVFAPRAPVDE